MEVIVGRTHLGIAKRLREADPAVIPAAQTFFTLTHNAHLDAAQMYAAKLYDKTRNAITISTVLDKAERVAGTFPHKTPPQNVRSIVAAARRRIQEFEKTLDVIENRRNEYLAHLHVNAIIDREGIFNRAELTFDDLDELFVETVNILNDISQMYNGTLAVPALPNADDCENIFRMITAKNREV